MDRSIKASAKGFKEQGSTSRHPSHPATPPKTEAPPPLGEAGCPVRVLNFAGGAFDTVMQLGVAHALLVIQGRAPDAIVGASAGAIQAVAVAEILQAGEDIVVDRDQDEAAQQRTFQRCRAARVERFRDMVRGTQRAPEELVDASLPDAYQIDSHDPLQPLRTARYPNEERDRRESHLVVRSGLVALYNHVLGVRLTLGTITRLIRRWLGFKAAAEIRAPCARLAIRVLELFRIWLLIGTALPRLVTSLPLLFPWSLSLKDRRAATAGSLIFRFPPLRLLWTSINYAAGLALAASVWVIISLVPAAIIYCLLPSNLSCLLPSNLSGWLTVGVFSLVAPIGMGALELAVARWYDALRPSVAVMNGLKGVLQFAITMVFLGAISIVVIQSIFTLLFHDTGLPGFHEFINTLAWLLCAGAVILMVIAIGLWPNKLACRDDQGQPVSGKALTTRLRRWYGESLLRSYRLSRSLLHHYGLEKFLSDLFDPNYYGRSDRGRVWEESLKQPVVTGSPPREPGKCADFPSAKRIRYYSSKNRNPPIVLGLAVADVGSGKVDVMDEEAPVVCGLRAAGALTPLFPPVRYKGRLFVDSTNVSPVPMPALLSLLRRHGVNEKSTVVQVYRVAPVPFSRPLLPQVDPNRPLLNLIDIALRALTLQRYRDADLERRLTERYTHVIPPGRASVTLEADQRECFRIWVAPIELELPIGLNARIMQANRDERRAEILTTIASGCRAALQVMIADSLNAAEHGVQSGRAVPCGAAVRHHFSHCIASSLGKTFGSLPLPGSRKSTTCETDDGRGAPPGLWEICSHCQAVTDSDATPGVARKQVLVRGEWANTAPNWPHEFATEASGEEDRHFEAPASPAPDPETIEALGRYWPRERSIEGGPAPTGPVSRPLVSLLFSGGVFRGVFQLGVVNALAMLGVKPDIVAGASIGSITAGMAAQLLCATENANERAERIARLAATYLAVDRIILTDRFADFVREFTVRAAQTRFSLRHADRLFRKYDQPSLINFDKGARQVIAGIERLFYINPYQLNQLVKAARHRHAGRTSRLGRQLAQQWLTRMGVAEEVLGAEALTQLIEYFIPAVNETAYFPDDPAAAETLCGTFAPFLRKGVMLLATATDLTDGRLLTLGDPFQIPNGQERIDLSDALLASSAFPGVFRPRWAPEVFPETCASHQLIDGGVMDNLPIDAVLNVLWKASAGHPTQELLSRRPGGVSGTTPTPHLAFAASLEPELEKISGDEALGSLDAFWPALRRRAKQLRYNGKLDNYQQAAREINNLYDQYQGDPKGIVPLNLEIAAVKPRWLCGTFAFHPMLGYRRTRQAESIAHGCAMTLLTFKSYENAPCTAAWLSAWGIEKSELPVAGSLDQARALWQSSEQQPGACWLRPERRCPFSKEALYELNKHHEERSQLQKSTIEALSYIHICCERRVTHEPH